ncbi:MAG: pilus assembly protein CpaE [Acetobacteraceae bacterium]|jgi:pilus assembly protein CpaE|nr:pilus assembly protein CpaE [Acetobacteraceae bacterium]
MTETQPDVPTVDRRRAGRPQDVSPELIPLLRGANDSSAVRHLATRHRRPALIAFVTDSASERAFVDGLADILPTGVDVRRGGIRAAITSMRKSATPGVLVVDISDEDQPLTALAQLADVVEPDVTVLVIGEVDSVDFYREVTRNLGAHDYLSKPLSNDKVVRRFGPIIAGRTPVADGVQGGGLVIVTGVGGGVGATTIAVNLAGHFGVSLRRHTVLLDPDLHAGDASLLLNIKPGPGLRMALEAPERIDALLAERAAQPISERLHLLAGDEPLTTKLNHAPGAAASLVAALRRRYNLIIADASFRVPLYDDLLELPHQRVLVMLPTLASVRAALRHLSTPNRNENGKRPVIVLNRLGSPGSLTRRQIEDALAAKVDVAIPDQPRQVAAAATMGELAMTGRSGFRNGIQELAGHVGLVGLLDSTAATVAVKGDTSVARGWSLFRRKS